MLDNVLDLPAEDASLTAEGIVAQLATIVRAYAPQVQSMTVDEVRQAVVDAEAINCQTDSATAAARDLVLRLLTGELQDRLLHERLHGPQGRSRPS